MTKETIQCKRCKSDAKIVSTSQSFLRMCLYSMICAIVFYFIPVISLVAPVFLGLSLLMAIAAVYMKFKGGAIVECNKCNARYKISKYDYDEYKKSRNNI